MKRSILMAVAGPNGSGKSSVTSEASRFQPVGHYVNADEIQHFLGCTPLKAAQIAENTRELLLSQHESFTFETVLSTDRNIKLMRRAKEAGYAVICIYVLTADPEINVSRVKARVQKGGHDVPPEKVRERYHRAMGLFPELLDICDELYVYDNSSEYPHVNPKMIICKQNGNISTFPNAIWTEAMIKLLCNGTYSI